MVQAQHRYGNNWKGARALLRAAVCVLRVYCVYRRMSTLCHSITTM